MSDEFVPFLKFIPLFENLDDETILKIAGLGKTNIYHKDQVIIEEHDAGSVLFVIMKGKVKVSRESDDGKEVILTILGECEFFGEMSIIDGFERSANVIAIEESKLFLIERTEFLDLLFKYPEVSIALLQEFASRLRISNLKIKSLSLKGAEGKVATVILQIADTQGRIKKGKVEVENMPIQSDLAHMAGTSRETISRTLQTFVKKGLLEVEGQKMIINDYNEFKKLLG